MAQLPNPIFLALPGGGKVSHRRILGQRFSITKIAATLHLGRRQRLTVLLYSSISELVASQKVKSRQIGGE